MTTIIWILDYPMSFILFFYIFIISCLIQTTLSLIFYFSYHHLKWMKIYSLIYYFLYYFYYCFTITKMRNYLNLSPSCLIFIFSSNCWWIVHICIATFSYPLHIFYYLIIRLSNIIIICLTIVSALAHPSYTFFHTNLQL